MFMKPLVEIGCQTAGFFSTREKLLKRKTIGGFDDGCNI
ncbi:hypothetical protein GJA_4325 [Janthinobacterium agaricidamnosum NBRC 102515 = DSM 9628]|uniref:Uncharacterized protein n=1 Tax=Janthinobacterium agaricidamnosum NBRC 102515 = DSM 9628 TaxID=1349767 RepID=W0VC69_9BURK|nr:hypothetical protein GJA_4325 [Janthinobacterium agaricidamnosum NBRC 102515 = DSM 9628]